MAHLSLELVITFIILLVVAGVVISILFSNLNPSQLPNEQIKMNQMNFKSDCNRHCGDLNSVEYCRHYFEGSEQTGTDWDGDGLKEELLTVGDEMTWEACEDRIYCFLVVPCERFGSNPIEGCADALCSTYLKKYEGDVLEANKAVLDKVKKGSCELPAEEKDNWYKKYYPVDVCGCDCTPWVAQGIGMKGNNVSCTANEIFYNRSCLPVGCTKEAEEKCEPVSLTLSSCEYNFADETMSCYTNCENRTLHWTKVTVINSTNSTANASYIYPPAATVGNITFNITDSPLVDNEMIINTSPILTTLNVFDRANWIVVLNCSKPVGVVNITGVGP